MAYNGILGDLRQCVDIKQPSRVPYFPISGMYDFSYAGFTHKEWREDPEVMVKVALKAIEDFDYDIYMLHPDDLLEYEDMGMAITSEEDLPPAVSGYLPASEAAVKSLTIPPDLIKKGRAARHLEGIANLKRELGESTCITGRIAAPFSAVTLLVGIDAALLMMLENPLLLKRYMDFLVEYNDIVAQAQLEAGADAIWLGDCVASSHFISPAQYKNFAAEYADESINRIKRGGGLVFYHGNEKSIAHLKIMCTLGFDAINIGEGADIGEVKGVIGGVTCIMGNFDTINDLQAKSPPEIESIVKDMVLKAKGNGGYIFCTGEGIPQNTPAENMKAMTRAVKAWGKY